MVPVMEKVVRMCYAFKQGTAHNFMSGGGVPLKKCCWKI